MTRFLLLAVALPTAAAPCAQSPASAQVEKVTVTAKVGRTVDFFARTPEGYCPAAKRCAVLVYFGGRGSRGEELANWRFPAARVSLVAPPEF